MTSRLIRATAGLLVTAGAVTGIGGSGVAGATQATADDTSTASVTALGAAGSGVPAPPGTRRAADLTAAGYLETEYSMTGDATIYSGPATGPARATKQVQPYSTRIVVRAPSRPAEFSGRVMVEPFNTSGAGDNDATWGMIGTRLLENGDAWIGVTVRNSSATALTASDAARYASMSIATNGLAWDMLSQLGRLLRSGTKESPLATLPVKRLYMAGYSQSAIDTATYASAMNPLARKPGGGYLYDGFLLMARAGSTTPLDPGAEFLPKFEILPIGKGTSPIVDVESQGDVQGFTTPVYASVGAAAVRRGDSDAPKDRFRLYEISGGSHVAKSSSPCDHQGTTFPLRYFERAALGNLYAWAERGTTPPRAPRIKTTTIGPVSTFALDEDGNVIGGVRSPYLDVPLSRYEGTDTPGPLCALTGVETPLDTATLRSRYTDVNGYIKRFTASLDQAIKARVLLEEDREAMLTATRTAAEQAFSRP